MRGTYLSTTFAVPLCLEFINTVNISFYRCGYNIRICSEAIINLIIIFHLHMNLTYIITSLANGLNSEFFQCHVTIYDLFQSLDGSIHRTITTRTGLQTSHRKYLVPDWQLNGRRHHLSPANTPT